jgi:hypothetical protein
MPNMDGPTAIKAIRALGYTAPIFGKMNAYLDMMLYMYICMYIYIYVCLIWMDLQRLRPYVL